MQIIKQAWLVQITRPFDFGKVVEEAVFVDRAHGEAWARRKLEMWQAARLPDAVAADFNHETTCRELDLIEY